MKIQNDPIRAIDEKIMRKIDLKETELENIGKMYEKRIEAANTQGDENFVEHLDRNKQKIVIANLEYEDKLKTYQDNLAHTQKNIELNESKSLDLSKTKQSNLKLQTEEKYSKIYNNARDNEESLFLKSQNDARQLDQKSRHEKLAHEGHAKQQLAAFAGELTQNTKEQEENLKKQLESEQTAMAHTLIQNKMDTQTRMIESNGKNQRIENEQKRVQVDQLKFQDDYQANLLKQKQHDFDLRYQQLSAEHQVVLDTLTAKLHKTTEAAIAANEKEKKSITDINSDPFYQLEILKPKVTEDPKNYFVHLEVPPHEKENVHLMAHGREIRITMSRKYSSALNDSEDNSVNRTSKTQLYSKEFEAKEIMNPKQISQKYENGILSFKIAKL
jgi:HSP20 family molecular chaperone IbpA